MGAIVLSVTGNAVYHVIAAGLLEAIWIVVLSVGAVPALVLGLVSHLAMVRGQEDEGGTTPKLRRSRPAVTVRPMTEGRPKSGPARPVWSAGFGRPRYGGQDELLAAAREADAAYREAHGGRAISRDEMRRVLRIGTDKASALARELRAKERSGSLRTEP